MYLALDSKVVLVTGGTRGIGRSIVRGFLKEGATVYFCARAAKDVNAANELYSKDYPDAKAIGSMVDVTNTGRLEEWVNGCARESSRINVVVANVSSLSIEDTADNFQAAFQTDLMGTYHLIQTAIPHLEKTKGSIVTIAAGSAREVDFTSPGPYGAMKAALVHYTFQLSRTLAAKGVRANTVSPGDVYVQDGPMGEIEKADPEEFKKLLALNPMGRMGRPEEIADAVVWVASERASFVTGANLLVDGGFCRGVQF